MIKRVFNSKRINEIVNDKSVFDLIAPEGIGETIDLTDTVNNLNNFVLMDFEEPSLGGFVFFATPISNTYEVHTQFLPEGRGQYAYGLAKDALHYMFCKTDCVEVLTKVPRFNHPANAFAKSLGFTQEFTRKNAWIKKSNSSPHDLDFLSLRFLNWALNDPDSLIRGNEFRKTLDKFQIHVNHPTDVVHDKVVGACLEIIFSGPIDKAIHLYNKWTLFAGYEPALKITSNPLVLSMGNLILEFDLREQSFTPVARS